MATFPEDFDLARYFLFDRLSEGLGKKAAIRFGDRSTSYETVAETMRRFRAEGRMPVPDPAWQSAAEIFRGFALDDEGTLAEIARLHREAGYLADPHTAIGTAAALAVPPSDLTIPVVVAATAHPAKVPDAVRRATGITPPLPARLADLYQRPERLTRLPAELDAVEAFVRRHARRNAA